MFRSIFIPIIVSVLALFGFYSSEVLVTLNMPTSAKAGDEFLVEVTINKGDIEGFARFQQELPVGFTAVARETANGDFRFEDQKVKIQWMQVPFDRTVVITYAVQVAPTISGEFNFDGKFSYIYENSVQTATVAPQPISIIGDEMAAGTAADANTTYSYQNVSLKVVDCIRQKPFLNENNEVIVNLLVNKGDLNGFGKIQEQIPRGYTAESIKSKNSIFTFKNSIIKFLWMTMPAEQQFVVSYKLIPEAEIPDQAFIISGTFSYAENERTKTINIADREIDLNSFTEEGVVAQNVTTETKPVETKNNASDVSSNTNSNSNSNSNTTSSTAAVVTPVYTQTVKEPKTNTETKTQSTTETKTQSTTKTRKERVPDNPNDYDQNVAEITGVPSPEQGIGYRVQIAAGHNLVNERYFKKLNITDEVQIEIHEGWHKYTVGNFPLYRDARDYRVYVWNNTPIHDAFVAAYNNGLRITVQEALMIANQKWYQ